MSHDGSTDSKVHIKKIAYSSIDDGTLIKVYSTSPLEYSTYKLSDPTRIAVEIPNVVLDFEPRRSEINDTTVSHVSVVAFPEIDSVRLELELYKETPFRIIQKKGRLEILVTEGSAPSTTPLDFSETKERQGDNSTPQLEASYENKSRQELIEDLKILRAKLAEEREKIINFELENNLLRQQASEAQKQFDETISFAETLQARVVFMEKQLSNIQTRLLGDEGPAESDKVFSQTPIAGPDDPETAIRNMISAWLLAWNGEDVKNYANYYSSDFKFGYMNKKEWIADKAIKFKRPGIPEIKIEEIEISVISGKSARAKFQQIYSSRNFNSRGLKTLSLTKESGQWKILDENWSRPDN